MSWLKRNQKKQDPESIYTRHVTAVAAAAFAIQSVEEAERNGNHNGNKKQISIVKQLSNEIIKQFSFKKTKSSVQNHEKPDKVYLARKPSRLSSRDLIPSEEEAAEKAGRNGKLKSVLSWASAKKTNGKDKMETNKD